MAFSAVQKKILNQLIDYIPALRKGQIGAKDGGDILLGDAIAPKPTAITALGTTAALVGVDGTGSNAAPLVGTEARLDAIEAKVDALIAALKA